MSRVVAVSPHLDDAVLGRRDVGPAGRGRARGARAHGLHGSVAAPTGFALTRQTDKGVAPDAEYMARRRYEDAAAMARRGLHGKHLGLLDAPHGATTPPGAVFAGRRRATTSPALRPPPWTRGSSTPTSS